jgi:ribulose-phosphate 3-epimerase
MARPVLIAPSLLAADLARAGDEMNAVSEAGADMLHVDVMDGHFAPNLTFGPSLVASLDKACDLPMSTHLMVNDPGKLIEPFAEAGSDDLFFHPEVDGDHVDLARRIADLGVRPGAAIEIDTQPETIKHLVGHVGILLVMTVRCGYTGQTFNAGPVEKIPELRRMFGDEVDIAVDGGVGLDNAAMLVEAGANVLIAGKGVFWAEDRTQAVSELRAAGQAGLNKE